MMTSREVCHVDRCPLGCTSQTGCCQSKSHAVERGLAADAAIAMLTLERDIARSKFANARWLTDDQIDALASSSEGGEDSDLAKMADLVVACASAKTNGEALFKLMKFRKQTRVQAIRAALAASDRHSTTEVKR